MRESDAGTARVLPAGEEQTSPFGKHYLVRTSFDSEHFHGKVRLGRFSCEELHRLMHLMHDKKSPAHRDSIVFLDTETTGMQGGTGMVPFLVGLGYFEQDNFHVAQYFIRDFDEEPSMLHAIEKILSRFELVITYNGGSFDIPLLESRFTLARFDNPFSEFEHLDLLIGARRLWRNGHGSCRLVALEKEIISFLRGPDIPGSVIPRVFFDFVSGAYSPSLPGVFTHNMHDVVSLAALTICAADRMTAEPARFDNPSDLFSLAKVLENTTEWKRSRMLYEMALAGSVPEPLRSRAAESLSVIYRRAGEHERALAACTALMDAPAFSLCGYEGAAIYHERIARDPMLALNIVERALSRLEQNLSPHKRWRLLLEARRERLRQKVIQF
jgi:uncharacterized protein YprB with RNaseH-like and TPR domain